MSRAGWAGNHGSNDVFSAGGEMSQYVACDVDETEGACERRPDLTYQPACDGRCARRSRAR